MSDFFGASGFEGSTLFGLLTSRQILLCSDVHVLSVSEVLVEVIVTFGPTVPQRFVSVRCAAQI